MTARLVSASALVPLAVLAAPAALGAQLAPGAERQEVSYFSGSDSTLLTATLTMPEAPGPHPGVVVFSIAGTTSLVDALVAAGHAVLTPVRRGFVDVEPLLRADYADLAGDVLAAVRHLGAREEVDAARVAVVAQADDAPPALLAAASSSDAPPLVLLAPPAFPGDEEFRRSQRWLAERYGADPEELEALDRYTSEIAEIALTGAAPYVREHRLDGLRSVAPVELPRNAAFPADERQAHFFASPLWHDRLAFRPEVAFSRLASPVLVLIGEDDVNTPLDDYLAAVRRGLEASRSEAADVCVVPGRTRHTFTDQAVAAVLEWLEIRVSPDAVSRWGPSAPCAR